MVAKETFFQLCLSFPGTEQKPHFDRTAFKVIGKKIFASYHEPSNSANLKLSPNEQKTFSSLEGGSIYPVANKWGLQGWTTFELTDLDEHLVLEALTSAYELAKGG